MPNLRQEQPGTTPSHGEIHPLAPTTGPGVAVADAPAETAETTHQPSSELPHTASHQEKILSQPQIPPEPLRTTRLQTFARGPRASIR